MNDVGDGVAKCDNCKNSAENTTISEDFGRRRRQLQRVTLTLQNSSSYSVESEGRHESPQCHEDSGRRTLNIDRKENAFWVVTLG